jgi:murein DD-endopeptidase MepM/ murein hydrolase activator NlpD
VSQDRSHHSSKRNRYTVVLVHNEEASDSRTYRLAPWQLVVVLLSMAAILVVCVIVAFVYTPLGVVFPISNPELENRYGKELASLNQRMSGVLEQLVELRAYNVKLRKALGEPVVLTDSGAVRVARPQSKEDLAASRSKESQQAVSMRGKEMPGSPSLPTVAAVYVMGQSSLPVSFPAVFPVQGYLTRGYEPERGHFGLDIAGKVGTPVLSAADGNVVFAGWTDDAGYLMIVAHAAGFMTFYKHNESMLSAAGSFVKRGEPIATLGSTGRTSSGPHLHFEIWKDGVPVDPSRYILNSSL